MFALHSFPLHSFQKGGGRKIDLLFILSPKINNKSKNMFSLSRQQEGVLERFHQGKNIFLTGSAGTGKSFLIQRMCSGNGDGKIQVCAMTGIAAVLLNAGSSNAIKAKTIHSWSGIKLCNIPDKNVIINRVLKNKRVRKPCRAY